jgi:hypothetical protein
MFRCKVAVSNLEVGAALIFAEDFFPAAFFFCATGFSDVADWAWEIELSRKAATNKREGRLDRRTNHSLR